MSESPAKIRINVRIGGFGGIFKEKMGAGAKIVLKKMDFGGKKGLQAGWCEYIMRCVVRA
jgi:hypothetical protein